MRSKAKICEHSITGMAGSNDDMDIRLLCLLCVVPVAAFVTS